MLETEQEMVNRFVRPSPGDGIFDAGCGTGIFTLDFLDAGAVVTGMDISRQMLRNAIARLESLPFHPVQGDMTNLPFGDGSFDKSVSVTALEFIEDARTAVNELFRVTRPGGIIVLATLNSLSPWSERRNDKTLRGEKHVLEHAFYRSPSDLLALSDLEGETETAVHFLKDDEPDRARLIEKEGKSKHLDTGAFAVVRWRKPA